MDLLLIKGQRHLSNLESPLKWWGNDPGNRRWGSVSSESPDGKWLYFNRDKGAESSLWKMPAGGGPETQVLPFVYNFNFAVTDDVIYFVTKDEHGFAIKSLTCSGKVQLVASIKAGYFGFSVSPCRKWISFIQASPPGSELTLADGFRLTSARRRNRSNALGTQAASSRSCNIALQVREVYFCPSGRRRLGGHATGTSGPTAPNCP